MAGLRLTPRAWIALAGGGVAAAVVGVGLFTIGPLASHDAATPTPRASAVPSAEPTASPSVTASADVVFTFAREASIDDATALARMANPRTGETWHAPVEAPQYDALLPERWDGPPRAFIVGERAGFDIVIGVGGYFDDWYKTAQGPLGSVTVALWEIHDDAAYVVTCPSARQADPCTPGGSDGGASSVLFLNDVFYDSLTYPASVRLDGSLTGRLSAGNGDPGGYPGYYPLQAFDILAALQPEAFAPFAAPTTSTVSTLPGGSTVVRVEISSNISGVTNAFYGFRTPFGGTFYLDPHESTDEYGPPVVSGLTWDASATPPTTLPIAEGTFYSIPAAGFRCDSGIVYSIDHTHDSGDWTRVATDDLGRAIFAPVAGGNRVALAVYTRMQDMTGWGPGADLYAARLPKAGGGSGIHTEPTEPYPFATYDEFVAQYGVLTYEIAPGEWALAARAMASIFECA